MPWGRMVAGQGRKAWTWGRSCHCPEGQLVKVALDDVRALLDEGEKAGDTLMDSQVSRNSQGGWVLTFCGWSRSVSSPLHEVVSRGPTLEITCLVLAC